VLTKRFTNPSGDSFNVPDLPKSASACQSMLRFPLAHHVVLHYMDAKVFLSGPQNLLLI